MWGEELHTSPLPRNSVEDAERASRQLDDQVGQEGHEWILDREGRAWMDRLCAKVIDRLGREGMDG